MFIMFNEMYIYIYVYRYVGLTTTTLSRRLTMHLNDSYSTALHLKTHSIPKIQVENSTLN